ncbi:hypothetical protein N7523_011120 [Penicillium sp. IBT 18751x]|nr:hypothetical protein N7523_011120 [Penicillium sp. IBT 18751x]
MTSQSIWISVLALSEASMKLQRSDPSILGNDKAMMCPSTTDVQMDVTQLLFLRSLHEAKHYITDMYIAWSPRRWYDKELMETFAQLALGRDLGSASYWLLVRFGKSAEISLRLSLTDNALISDLAAALATDTNIQVPLPNIFPYCAGGDTEDDPFANVFRFAHHPLWLCARAVEFVHHVDPSPQCPPVQAWVHLVEELERWHRDRPQGFQPIMELEIEDQTAESRQSFPLVLYANGGGLFANQLYHTAMLLLLQNRPRTAQIKGSSSAIMSPLWHAQRICSISLNNERRECWDACLLASFLSASRRMTHESQQEEILFGFGRIQKVTGWDAGRLLEALRAEWRLLEM